MLVGDEFEVPRERRTDGFLAVMEGAVAEGDADVVVQQGLDLRPVLRPERCFVRPEVYLGRHRATSTARDSRITVTLT